VCMRWRIGWEGRTALGFDVTKLHSEVAAILRRAGAVEGGGLRSNFSEYLSREKCHILLLSYCGRWKVRLYWKRNWFLYQHLGTHHHLNYSLSRKELCDWIAYSIWAASTPPATAKTLLSGFMKTQFAKSSLTI
jgi:hypothetical protein